MSFLRFNLFFWFIALIPFLGFAQSTPDTTVVLADSLLRQADTLVLNNDTSYILQDSSSLVHGSLIIISDSSLIVTDTNNQQVQVIEEKRNDSLDVTYYSFFKDSINYRQFHFIDTSNHTSDQFKPVKYFSVNYNDLGIVGSAHDNQFFSPSTNSGFSVGFNSHKAYIWNPGDINLFDNLTPYTNLLYVMGAKKEHALKLAHAQSFLERQLSLGLDFQLYNHLGAYENQQTDVKGFIGGLGYRTKNSQYSSQVKYYYNKLILEENGGIDSLDIFERNIESNRQIIATNLSSAENLIRKAGVIVEQAYYFSKPEPDLSKIPDTNKIEFEGYSVTHFRKPYFDPVSHLGQIKYYFNYQTNSFKYIDEDQNSNIYNNIPYFPTYDSSIMFDSIGMRKFENEMIYSNSDYKDDAKNPKFLNYFFGGRHEYVEYEQDSAKQFFTHYALIGGVFINMSSFLSILSDVEYYIGDYTNNDFLFNGKAFLKLKSNLFTGGIMISHRSPDWIYHSFKSSRFTWDNDFNKTNTQKLYLNFSRDKLLIQLQVQNIGNYVYFNSAVMPEQSSDNIQHISVQARKDFRIAHWGADINVIYQNVSHPGTIRVPELTGRVKLFYHHLLFNNALDLELGVELAYFTKYYANKYMPALRSFHIQDVQEIGDYPFVDAYINAKIGKARLFIRYDHFNAGMLEYVYYASPDYPAQDAAFRFGVSWLLFN